MYSTSVVLKQEQAATHWCNTMNHAHMQWCHTTITTGCCSIKSLLILIASLSMCSLSCNPLPQTHFSKPTSPNPLLQTHFPKPTSPNPLPPVLQHVCYAKRHFVKENGYRRLAVRLMHTAVSARYKLAIMYNDVYNLHCIHIAVLPH